MVKFGIMLFPVGAAMDMLFNGAKIVLATQSALLLLGDQAAHLMLPL